MKHILAFDVPPPPTMGMRNILPVIQMNDKQILVRRKNRTFNLTALAISGLLL